MSLLHNFFEINVNCNKYAVNQHIEIRSYILSLKLPNFEYEKEATSSLINEFTPI